MQPLKKNRFLEIKRNLMNEFYSRYKQFSSLRLKNTTLIKDQLALKKFIKEINNEF